MCAFHRLETERRVRACCACRRVCRLVCRRVCTLGAAWHGMRRCRIVSWACMSLAGLACMPLCVVSGACCPKRTCASLSGILFVTNAQCRRSASWSACASRPRFWRRHRSVRWFIQGQYQGFGFHTAAGRLWSTPCSRLHQCTLAPLVLQAAIAVFERQGVEADAYVKRRLGELGGRTGERLCWCVLCLLWSACDAGCRCKHWCDCTYCCHASAGTPCPPADAAPPLFPFFPLGMPPCPASVGLCAGCGGPACRACLTCSTPSAASCNGAWRVGGLRHTNAQAPLLDLTHATPLPSARLMDALEAVSSIHCPPSIAAGAPGCRQRRCAHRPLLSRSWFASAAMQTCAPSCCRCCWSGTCCSRGGRRQERTLARCGAAGHAAVLQQGHWEAVAAGAVAVGVSRACLRPAQLLTPSAVC